MPLSNYLLQSFIATALFYGGGFGLGGQLGPTLLVPLALLIFGAQVRLRALWLRQFRYGPVEWLWRSLTYGQRQPMPIRSAPVVVAVVP